MKKIRSVFVVFGVAVTAVFLGCTNRNAPISSPESAFSQDGGMQSEPISPQDGGLQSDRGIQSSCPENFIDLNGLCCPENLPQRCGNRCLPADCQCVEEYEICVPPDMTYCGAGISCALNEQCVADGNTFHCVAEGRTYCDEGIACDSATEDCVLDESGSYCISKNWIPCGREKKPCQPNEYCTDTELGCCPQEQLPCGQSKCCFRETEQCIHDECVSFRGVMCNGMPCPEGYKCPTDGLPFCVPERADYCGGGRYCDPGNVCTFDGACCPEDQSQRCNGQCCPDWYQCVNSEWGQFCIPPWAEPCGQIWCGSGEFCAREGLCLDDGNKLCPAGHWCESGTYCAGSTCCSYHNPRQCGNLCCPSSWQCINNGEACIPDGAQYIGNGRWCDEGWTYNPNTSECLRGNWQICGNTACPSDMVCASEDDNKRCCPADAITLCGEKCCPTGFQCIHDGNKDICLHPGAIYCYGQGEQEWCPAGKYCGRKYCIPIDADECNNGDFCPIREVCTESNPPCCPVGTSVTCGEKCCADGSTCCSGQCCMPGYDCLTFHGQQTCLPPDTEICTSSIMGESICYGDTFCENDGYCMPDSYSNRNYDYCGGGKRCPSDEQCGGLCTDFCCDKEVEEECDLQPCFPVLRNRVQCVEEGTSVRCCIGSFRRSTSASVQQVIVQIEQCGRSQCRNLACSYEPSLDELCCTYEQVTPVGCLKGCVPAGRICYDSPTSTSPTAYLAAEEKSITPDQVPHEVAGEEAWDFITDVLGFGDVDINFHPAGFSPRYRNGVYHVKEDPGTNWVNRNNPQITLQRGDEVLVVEAFWAIDCLEGIDFPHGPYAQLYCLVYSASRLTNRERVARAVVRSPDNGYGSHLLRGPFEGDCTWEVCYCILGIPFFGCVWDECACSFAGFDTNAEDEWISYASMHYTPGWAGLHKWAEGEESIVLTLRESDSSWPEQYREDDYMGFELISREETKRPCGLWVLLYKYEPEGGEDNPQYFYRTDRIAGRILLRTITCTGRPEDPC